MFAPGVQATGSSDQTTFSDTSCAHPYKVDTITNPTQDELRSLALEHTPAVTQTAQGNLVKVAKNKARKAQWTYVIAPEQDADKYSCKTIDRERADAIKVFMRERVPACGVLA